MIWRELPPHARRILSSTRRALSIAGTTSACAENTNIVTFLSIFLRNYLRMRGEYGFVVRKGRKHVELPPHARRIHMRVVVVRNIHGTTSACAENTRADRTNVVTCWNYLRMRGEYSSEKVVIRSSKELPPHARRIPANSIYLNLLGGTTSACAENTSHCFLNFSSSRNYLRMRGEYVG